MKARIQQALHEKKTADLAMILVSLLIVLSASIIATLYLKYNELSALIASLLSVTGIFLALELKRTFTIVRQSNLFHRNILDSMPSYVALIDRDLRVLWTNAMFKQDFGNENGKKCHQLYFNVESPCENCVAQASFHNGTVSNREHSLTTQDGRTLNLIMYCAPIRNESGQIVAVIELGVNITSVKEMQKRLTLLGLTVSGMAHSIKNIMMGLDGGIYVVSKGLEEGDDAEVKEGWDMVLLNFDKISKLVQDILYCSKEREPDFQKVRPNEILKEVYDLFRETARSYEIELKLELDERIGEAVMDPKGFHTVLANLVTNAIDACKIDIWHDSHQVRLRSKKGADGSIIIEVADDGIGMDKETEGHTFEDFFTTKGQQGTGLGLMVTQKILEEHGGSVSFRSRPRKGTTFTAIFPAQEPEPTSTT